MINNLLSYSGISTKIKAMEAKLITNKEYKVIANFDTVTDFITFLSGHPGYREIFANYDEVSLHRTEVEQILSNALYLDFAKIYRFADPKQRQDLDLLLFRYEVTLLKSFVRLIYSKEDAVDLSMIYSIFESYTSINLSVLIAILHKSMVSPDISGIVTKVVPDGRYTINDPIVTIKDRHGKEKVLSLTQKWPIRIPRPVAKRFTSDRPLITGQRILDTLFPIAKGGTAAIPGGFGTGKTMTQHQLAKWSDADIIVYVGCGERGNEMTEVLEDFSKLVDPKSGNPLLSRTTLIANTSNMPVAAREASIYTGITLAEYYRDMGYHVAIMADSTSRWAEALRELSGRLEEMPAEEGFPAYLASRLSAFYERAGYMQNLNGTEGSVSIIGAVSPQGGDFSEPVTQNTKRFVRCFWALDKSLAYARHFPAIQWLTSYSEYLDDLTPWYTSNVGADFIDCRNQILNILTQESQLNEIVKLIGSDVLPDDQKLILEIARVIRLGFVQQNAYHPSDTYVPLNKQLKMMETILYLYTRSKQLINMNMPMSVLREEDIFDKIISIKYDVSNDELDKFDIYKTMIDTFYNRIIEKNA